MATAREPKPVKKLGELLQEQQEPFVLKLFLVEKGYLRKSFNGGSSFPFCHGNSRKSLKSSFNLGLKSSKKGISHCPKILRNVYNQVMSFNQRLRIKTSNHRDENVDDAENKENRGGGELERFSSASSSTVFNSCSESDAEETSTSQQKDHISFTTNTPESFRLCNLIENEVIKP